MYTYMIMYVYIYIYIIRVYIYIYYIDMFTYTYSGPFTAWVEGGMGAETYHTRSMRRSLGGCNGHLGLDALLTKTRKDLRVER